MAKSAVRARTLDFSNVKESSGINPKHLEEGEYLGKVLEVRDDPAKDGEAMWNFLIQPEDHKTATYPYYVKLVENQLWKLRNLFLAAGVDIPKKAVKIDPNKVVGKTLCIVLEDDEYDGKTKSVIAALMPKEEFEGYQGDSAPADDEDDEDDEEDEPAPVAKKRGRPKKVVEPEEDDEDEDDEEEEPAPKKRGRGRPRKVVEPEDDEDEDDDDEEEEPAPKKKRGRPAKAAAPAKKKRRAAADDDDDDLDIDL